MNQAKKITLAVILVLGGCFAIEHFEARRHLKEEDENLRATSPQTEQKLPAVACENLLLNAGQELRSGGAKRLLAEVQLQNGDVRCLNLLNELGPSEQKVVATFCTAVANPNESNHIAVPESGIREFQIRCSALPVRFDQLGSSPITH